MDHLRKNGFPVKVQDLDELGSIKSKHRVPRALQSCHTALIGTYVVEGHVPADVIKRLLRERPAVLGLAVPGMPIGSPGMEDPGSRPERYEIISFDGGGAMKVYDRR